MIQRLFTALVAAAIVSLVVPLMLDPSPGRPGPEEDPLRAMDARLDRLGPDAMATQAEGFLATDRPWRAARVMRRYVEQVREPALERRVLAARAEAGWGAWSRVHGLLDGVEGLDGYGDGIGLYLLGRARDDAGDAAGAVAAYRSFRALSPAAGSLEREREAARLRLGLALIRAGDADGGRRELAAAARLTGDASPALAFLEADALAAVGDTAAVRGLVSGHDAGLDGLRARRARIEAARAAGDLAGARALANTARAWARTDATRTEFLVTAGRIALEMGDTAAARGAFRAAIDRTAAGPHARAAAELLGQGAMSPDDHLAVARVLRAQGFHEESVAGYRAWLAAGRGTAAERSTVHLEHANALFYAERYDEVGDALRPVAGQTAARFLLARAENRRGDVDGAVRIYMGLAERFAGTGNGAQALYLAATIRHEEGDHRAARELYRNLVSRYPRTDVGGLSVMRLAGMAFLDGDHAGAARLWDDYRRRFPAGARALQATYWAGRAHAEMGDSAAAADRFRTVRRQQRDSYYALLASQRLGEPFWPLPMSAAPAADAGAARRVAGWLRSVDLLRDAGFPDDASAEVDRVVARAGPDRATRYALAEALAERGYSQRAIRIGIGLSGSGDPDPRLLRILYPFPYRTLITEEAGDRGLDPFLAAALIRQESMFEERITSHVGARGLMQIMPATGARLAESIGIDPYDPEILYHPEINVHLGVHYLAQHIRNYDGSLPAVFSAYNAGAHRVEWWSEFAEYGNDELFTERIPYRETRDYVKILTRNMALYAGLYGSG